MNLRHTDHFTVPNTFLSPLPTLCQEENIQLNELLSACDIPQSYLQSEFKLVSVDTIVKILSYVEQLQGHPIFAIKLAARQQVERLFMLRPVLQQCTSVRQLFLVLAQHMPIIIPGLNVDFSQTKLVASISMSYAQPIALQSLEAQCFVLNYVMTLLQQVTQGQMQVRNIQFKAVEPASHVIKRMQLHLPNNQMSFNQDSLGLSFANEWLDLPITIEFEELSFQQKIEPEQFIQQLREYINIALPSRQVHLDQVAQHFSMHPRALQRQLQQCGTNLRSLVDEVAKANANHLLTYTYYDMFTISQMLGCKNQSAFSMLCKKWFGMSASQYRNVKMAEKKKAHQK